jgi:hypothetical protein
LRTATYIPASWKSLAIIETRGKVKFDHQALFNELKARLPGNVQVRRRFGGSSGKARYDPDLLKFLSREGTTCRQGIGTILENNSDGRNWNFV